MSYLIWPLEFLSWHYREDTLSSCIVECLIHRFVFVEMNLLGFRRRKLSLVRAASSMANDRTSIYLVISQVLAIGGFRNLIGWQPFFHRTN